MNNILKLYPQYTQSTDRRQLNQSVDSERRLEDDRRHLERIADPKLSPDIAKIQNTYKAFINNTDTFQSSVNNLDKTVNKNKSINKAVFAALSPIIPVRRISSLPDNIEDGNYARAAGLLGLMVVNLPEDTRDLKDAWNQITKGKLPKYDYKNCQTAFSFFRGTILEPIVNKMGKFGVFLHKIDIPLENTKFGKMVKKILKININELESEGTSRLIPKVIVNDSGKTVIKEVEVIAHKIEGSSLAKLFGRALLRIPVLSVVALGLLEIPIIIRKINNTKDSKSKVTAGSKQTIKAIINVVSIQAGISLIGALFAKKGPAFSLLGMGIGSVAGAYASKAIQKEITDKK